MKRKIEITVGKTIVSKNGWYKINYMIVIDDDIKNMQTGQLDGSYSGQTAQTFRRILRKYHAFDLVLQHYY
jgi:hypothetical protein